MRDEQVEPINNRHDNGRRTSHFQKATAFPGRKWCPATSEYGTMIAFYFWHVPSADILRFSDTGILSIACKRSSNQN